MLSSPTSSHGGSAGWHAIRKQQKNYYNAQYTSLHVYCTIPATLSTLETNLRQNDHVLRWMPLKMDHVTPLDDATRFPNRQPRHIPTVDLEADPAEAMRWEYRNLVMQRVSRVAPSRSS